MKTSLRSGLEGLKLVSFESRRAQEMAELIRNYGGEPFIAPSMREISLSENSAAMDFFLRLEAGGFDYLILLTGVGTRTLVEAIASRYSRERIVAALQKSALVVRGPKPAAALRELGLKPAISVPEPNTWKEVLSELDTKADIKGRRVAVQEYGKTNPELIAGLEVRGAQVVRVPVYRWALPEDTGPLQEAIQKFLDGQVDVALFTNATQVDHLFQLAREKKLDQPLLRAFNRVVIASVGPVCSDALEQFGLKADLEPEHPKMGHLISTVSRRGRELLVAKRRGEGPS